MDINVVVDTFRNFILEISILTAPILIITFLVAVMVGALQAMMQIQEQTLSFLPKMVVLFGSLYYMAPWMLEKLINLMDYHIENIPGMW